MKKVLKALPVIILGMLFLVNIASAHVTVTPVKVTKNSYQKFTVKVPNEMDKLVTKVKLLIPQKVDVSSVEPVPNWSFKLSTDKTDKITAITWSATDKGLMSNEFIEFNILGLVSNSAKQLSWKAYQTYGGGTVVKWIGPVGSDHPASVTKVVNTTASSDNNMTDKQTTASHSAPPWSLSLSIIAVILGVLSLIISLTRKNK